MVPVHTGYKEGHVHSSSHAWPILGMHDKARLPAYFSSGRQFSGDPAAIAGFNFNDTRGGVMRPVKFATLPYSGTNDIARLVLTSNVGHPQGG